MAQTLGKGQNVPLPPGPVAVQVQAAAAVDVSALLLTAAGKVRGDDDFVFYNQPSAGGVRHRADGVDVDPAQVPEEIERVVVSASLDGGGPATFGQLGGLTLTVSAGGAPVATFVPDGLTTETALLCVEVYRRQGAWKLRAVGQGYADGLAGIATNFGITVGEEPAPAAAAAPPPPPPPPAPATPAAPAAAAPPPPPPPPPPAPAAPAAAPAYGDSKITLTKRGQSVDLTKGSGGAFVVNLNWNQAAPADPSAQKGRKRGFLQPRSSGGIDLDLCCLFVLSTGQVSGIQALGGSFGSYDQVPWIQLDQDDRSGAATGGETLRINERYADRFDRILLYAMIYEGVANWAQADGIVRVTQQGGPTIEVALDESQPLPVCAVAMLTNTGGGQMKAERLVTYHRSQLEMDQAYGIGAPWGGPGRK
ncbi:TerD family protein [Nocardioides litoris]|uniref:TerD family protein n=1 Tax=Nocardioides litoris TaxID=1926648 RepID=UPI0011239163|nr:TerD family protein [Nocardioides litoris]